MKSFFLDYYRKRRTRIAVYMAIGYLTFWIAWEIQDRRNKAYYKKRYPHWYQEKVTPRHSSPSS